MATKTELSRDADAALEAVDARMIEAEKDRAFVEAVREAYDEYAKNATLRVVHVFKRIVTAHHRIYGTPCTASAKTEGK